MTKDKRYPAPDIESFLAGNPETAIQESFRRLEDDVVIFVDEADLPNWPAPLHGPPAFTKDTGKLFKPTGGQWEEVTIGPDTSNFARTDEAETFTSNVTIESYLNLGGSLAFQVDFPSITTSGSGGSTIKVFDNANGQRIAEFYEGGNVEIPNGTLSNQGSAVVRNSRFPIPNSDLVNSIVTVAGNAVGLGGSTPIALGDLSNVSASGEGSGGGFDADAVDGYDIQKNGTDGAGIINFKTS